MTLIFCKKDGEAEECGKCRCPICGGELKPNTETSDVSKNHPAYMKSMICVGEDCGGIVICELGKPAPELKPVRMKSR